jgi:hypothetical protein
MRRASARRRPQRRDALKRPPAHEPDSFAGALFAHRRRTLSGSPGLAAFVYLRWIAARGDLDWIGQRAAKGLYDLTNTRALAWGVARLDEHAALLYLSTPGADEFCDGASTCLDLARWCAARTFDPHGLELMRRDALTGADGQAYALLVKRLAYFSAPPEKRPAYFNVGQICALLQKWLGYVW